MRVYRRSKFQRHLVIPLMLTCFLSGCYKWSAQSAPITLDAAPERARITRTHENPSTELFRRAGDDSWRYVPRAFDPDHDPTMHRLLVALAYASIAAVQLSSSLNFKMNPLSTAGCR